jgi:hypothetical protein
MRRKLSLVTNGLAEFLDRLFDSYRSVLPGSDRGVGAKDAQDALSIDHRDLDMRFLENSGTGKGRLTLEEGAANDPVNSSGQRFGSSSGQRFGAG